MMHHFIFIHTIAALNLLKVYQYFKSPGYLTATNTCLFIHKTQRIAYLSSIANKFVIEPN